MNEDTLRRAVELAPGWYITDDDCVTTDEFGGLAHPSESTILLDALAAALVRLVSSVGDMGITQWGDDAVTINVYPDGRVATKAIGPDRTENTINCIVEFDRQNPGVLS